MSDIAERNFEDTIYEHLSQSGMYITRESQQFDLDNLFDTEMLENFLKTTQPDEWKKLERQFPGKEIESVIYEFHKLKHKRGLLSLLREGFPLQGAKLKFAYFKPAPVLMKTIKRNTRRTDLQLSGSFIIQRHFQKNQ